MNTQAESINIKNYFKTLKIFNLICQKERRLTPSAQLLFRLLAEQANSHHWTDSFTFPIPEIENISHLSRQTVVDARRLLKNLGYIDFKGKPARYIVHCLVDSDLDNSGTPEPPVLIRKYNTKERKKQERKEETTNDANANDSRHNRTNLGNPATDTEVERALAKLGY